MSSEVLPTDMNDADVDDEDEREADEGVEPGRNFWVLLEFFFFSICLFVLPILTYYSSLSICEKYLSPLKPEEEWNRDLILSAGAATFSIWIILAVYAYRAYCESLREVAASKKSQ